MLTYLVVPLFVIVPMSLTSGTNLTLPGAGLVVALVRGGADRSALVRGPGQFAGGRGWVPPRWPSVLATPAAVGLAWGRFPGRGLLMAVIATPLVLPIVILAVALFSFYATVGAAGHRASV